MFDKSADTAFCLTTAEIYSPVQKIFPISKKKFKLAIGKNFLEGTIQRQ